MVPHSGFQFVPRCRCLALAVYRACSTCLAGDLANAFRRASMTGAPGPFPGGEVNFLCCLNKILVCQRRHTENIWYGSVQIHAGAQPIRPGTSWSCAGPAHCAGRPGFIDRRWFCAVNPFSGYSHRPSADPSSSLGEQAASLRSDGRFCLQLVQGSSSVFFNVFCFAGHRA